MSSQSYFPVLFSNYSPKFPLVAPFPGSSCAEALTAAFTTYPLSAALGAKLEALYKAAKLAYDPALLDKATALAIPLILAHSSPTQHTATYQLSSHLELNLTIYQNGGGCNFELKFTSSHYEDTLEAYIKTSGLKLNATQARAINASNKRFSRLKISLEKQLANSLNSTSPTHMLDRIQANSLAVYFKAPPSALGSVNLDDALLAITPVS